MKTRDSDSGHFSTQNCINIYWSNTRIFSPNFVITIWTQIQAHIDCVSQNHLQRKRRFLDSDSGVKDCFLGSDSGVNDRFLDSDSGVKYRFLDSGSGVKDRFSGSDSGVKDRFSDSDSGLD
jgi:hypothetical protein